MIKAFLFPFKVWIENLLQKIIRFFAWVFLKDKLVSNINLFEKKVYSQNREDGILEIIFYKLKPTNNYFVEFGVEDGKQCNTRWLQEKGWSGLMMDSVKSKNKQIKTEFITAENIEYLFNKYKVPQEFDLLVIDIDFNDYWVWKAINNYNPRVVLIEYNSSVPVNKSLVVKYDPQKVWDETNYHGASLLALHKLGKKKGYSLVGCDSRGINSFFVRNDLIRENFIIKPIKKVFKSPQFGRRVNGKKIGHKPSKKRMIKI